MNLSANCFASSVWGVGELEDFHVLRWWNGLSPMTGAWFPYFLIRVLTSFTILLLLQLNSIREVNWNGGRWWHSAVVEMKCSPLLRLPLVMERQDILGERPGHYQMLQTGNRSLGLCGADTWTCCPSSWPQGSH